MVRGKIEIKKIDNLASRQVTFTKRRKGLFKKAEDLSVLCDAQVGVIVISSTSKVYDFASTGSSMKALLDEYRKMEDYGKVLDSASEAKLWKLEADSLRLKLEDLSKQHRLLKGEEGIADLNIQQIDNLEKQMEASIAAVRARKAALMYMEDMEVNSNANSSSNTHKDTGKILHEVHIEREDEVEKRSTLPFDLNDVYEPLSSLELQFCQPQLIQ
ncbi:hypothetical protein V2J09_000201 [Rumex salicifolius]